MRAVGPDMAVLRSPARNLIAPSAERAGSEASGANRMTLRLVSPGVSGSEAAGLAAGGGGSALATRVAGAGAGAGEESRLPLVRPPNPVFRPEPLDGGAAAVLAAGAGAGLGAGARLGGGAGAAALPVS